MKRIVEFLLLAVALMIGGACNDNHVNQLISHAEACMETAPNRAYEYLLLLEDVDDLSTEQQARYALLRTQAMHKCRMPLVSDSLIKVAVTYYSDGHDRHQQALSLLYKGLVHKQNHQVEQAVEAFASSEQAFEGVEDNQYKALLFNHYGALLMDQGVYEDALSYYKESYRYKLLGDSIHYVVSACGQIAKLYEIMNMPDSAETYFKRGLSYIDSKSGSKLRNHYLLLQGYATFLVNREKYENAEELLQECLANSADSENRHLLYSALTTLYYEKKELSKALFYGKQILASDDSLTVCGGYLRLYNIHRAMGQMDSAVHYHNLYRQYNSDITLRRRTAEIAVIPQRIKNDHLIEERQFLIGWRLLLAVSLMVVSLVALGVYVRINRRYHLEKMEKDSELEESKSSLSDTQKVLAETKVHLGQMKGALTHQSNAISQIKTNMEEIKKEHKEKIRKLKESIRKLEEEIKKLKESEHNRNHTETELKACIKDLWRQLKTQTSQLNQVEYQREIDQRIEHFMISDKYDSIAVNMLLQLRLDKERETRYDILPSQYLPLLKQLLEQENPALHEKLNSSNLAKNKLCMCCLIALELDDVDMMARAACLSPNSVKKYHKECRQLVDSLKEEQVNEN